MRAAEFPFPSQEIDTKASQPTSQWYRERWSYSHREAWRRRGYTFVSFLNWWICKYHTRLHHSISAEILALYFREKNVLKREKDKVMKNLEMGSWHSTKSSPCFSGAVFKYCCALCHCFTKAIMLSSLRWHQRQRAPTIYYASTTASLLFMHVEKWMVVGILFSHFKE